MEEMCGKMAARALEIQENPPKSAIGNEEGMYAIDRIVNNVCDRIQTLGFTAPECKQTPWKKIEDIKITGTRHIYTTSSF